MAKKILMFYYQGCANANIMMPAVLFGLGKSGKYSFEPIEMGKSEEGKKMLADYRDIIKKETGRDAASPVFVDPEAKKAVYAPDFEKLMGWLEGPDWWKKF